MPGMNAEVADRLIDRVKTLPPAPRIVSELLGLLRQEDVPVDRIVELITFDPALTAKVLRRCNSAAFGGSEPVHNLSEAVARVGFNDVYRLVAAVVGESLLEAPQRGYGIAAGELWHHSVTAALAARVTAAAAGIDENIAFTAALLHDIGKLVLSDLLERAYDAVMQETSSSGHSFLEAEQILLGSDHAAIGGRLLERWNFPDNLVHAVRHHHDPRAATPHEHLAACVHVSDVIAHCLGEAHGYQAFAVRVQGEALELLEITATELDGLTLESALAVKKAAWLLPNSP